MTELLASARTRLIADGPANLSLRAVARDLGVASSAVYRYVASRDALLTLLIIDAYDAVGQVAEGAAAAARADGADPASTWLAVARAVRAWALENPHSFELIYGTPVPGYRAPQDTVPAAVRIWDVIAGILRAGLEDHTLRPAGPDFTPGPTLDPSVYAFSGLAAPGAVPPRPVAQAVARSVTLFTSLIGALTAELFGHLHGIAGDPALLFDVTIATAAAGVGLHAEV